MLQEIENLSHHLNQLETDNWLQNDLFSYQWWIILIANLIFLALFVVLIDRKRILQIALAYMICFFFITLSDNLGEYLGFWSYPHQLMPFLTEFNAADFAIVPVGIALLYQMFKSWRMFFIVEGVTAAVLAFIGLPLFVYMNITKLLNWNYIYSFLLLLAIGILVKSVTDFIVGKNEHLKHLDENYRRFSFDSFRLRRKAR